MRIVKDKTYPKMFRIEYDDGSLSDMMNWSRVNDTLRISGSDPAQAGRTKLVKSGITIIDCK